MAKTIKTQDLEIVKLRIQMHTNMDTQVELTADKIDNKKVNGSYPFLCTNIKYSDVLLKQKTQDEIFDIFFNRQKFNNFVLVSKLKKKQTATTRYDPNIVKTNIIQMLNALFQISFPIKDSVILKTDENLDMIDMITNLLKSDKYTYLKLNKSSTVTQVIWLNTISSNPNYYEIYKKNRDFYKKVLDYATTVPHVKPILDSDISDIEKIQKIRVELKDIYDASTDKKIKDTITKEQSILHFLVSNYIKKTIEYNEFIRKYVQRFINSESTRGIYGISQEQYERQFYESVPEIIKIYQKYTSEIIELLPPKRISLNADIATTLTEAKKSNDFTDFMTLYTGTDKNKDCDLIKLEDGSYEIHLGVAVVGGKVSKTNYKFFCNYNSHRLGNDLNYLIRDIDEDVEKIRLYGYIDLENVKDTTEYVGVVNSSVKQKDAENQIKRGGKTRRHRHHNQKKTLRLYTGLF